MTSPIQALQVAKTAAREASIEEASGGWSGMVQDRAVSFFVSAAFHSAMLLISALFVYQQQSDNELTEIVEARLDSQPLPEAEAITFADVSVLEQMNADDETDSSQALKDVRQLANASEPAPVRTAFFSPHGVLPSTIPKDGNGFGGDALAGLGDSAGSGIIAGSGSEEQGDGEVGFFGTKAKGKSFVFIVDCSGSMTKPTTILQPRQPLVTRFVRARQELYSSLGQLSREQTFYIIFYNHETYPMFYPTPAQGMAPATTDHLGRARTWIQNVIPHGGTDPQNAFRLALALRPEIIFFLTDGAIPPGTRVVAKQSNKSRTRIHTVAFGLPNNQEILKGIAEDNQGRFRFVP